MKRVYIVLNHRGVPITEGENRGKWNTYEECEFLSTLKPRHYQEASLILDVINQKVIKCRAMSARDENAYETMIEYVKANYAQQYETLMKVLENAE